ncbi:MAG: SRPBCC family protein [Phormidesmis sp.]
MPIGEMLGGMTAAVAHPQLRAQGIWEGIWEGAWSEGGTSAKSARSACQSNYWAASTAPAETLWQLVTNLADLNTWHPLITSTNAPRGQRAKPGLIYRAVLPYLPISTQIFVERVLPGELLSIRLFPLPGLQERVTYRIVSTLCGTCVLYSITLSGWLSPLAWPVIKPHATKVAAALVAAAEQHMSGIPAKSNRTDIFGSPL